jgi:copper chaperone
MTHLELDITGMSCNHCVGAVTKALQSVNGVVVEQVAIGKATVSYDPSATSPAQISLAIEDEGFAVLTSP